MTEAQTSPAPGWYPDPGGSQGQRWWDGQAWTQAVQLPTAPTPTPVIEYAMSAAVPVAAPKVSQFGGPVLDPAVAPPVSHRAVAPSDKQPMSTKTKIGIAVLAAVLVAACALWALKVGGSSPETAPGGGSRGPASQAAAKLDALSLAAAEETVYAGRQTYLAIPEARDVIEMGQTVVHLSPQDSASIALNPSATGYCIVVTSTSPTTRATSTAVYVSTLGGLQLLATTCPASY